MAINRNKPAVQTAAKSDPAQAAASPVPTFSPEALATLLNEVTASRQLMAQQMQEITQLKADVAAKGKAPGKTTMSVAGKTMQQVKNELATIKAFHKAGFKNAQPHGNIFTFRKWTEKGRRPLEGSKALKINNLRLWHVDQTRPMTAAEVKAAKDQPAAAADRQSKASKSAQIVPIGAGASPQ